MSNLTKDLEKSNIERAETVNKLSKSLEESQRQNRDLLDAGMSTLNKVWHVPHMYIM